MGIEDIFPTIKDAHEFLRHKRYSHALQVYVDILNDVEEDSEEYSQILLEYAKCLIESIMQQAEQNYKKILQTKKPQDEEELEEDLENCWDCLETCRLHFTDLDNREKLGEVYKGLGDVQCLKNCFDEGRLEYLKALDHCDDPLLTAQITACIADCYRNMKLYDEAVGCYREVAGMYKKLGMAEDERECLNLVEGISSMALLEEGSESTQGSECEPTNVNHLRRDRL